MAIQTGTGIPKKAAGDAADTGTPVTPPPHAEFDRTAGQQFGENQYPGKVYLDPGMKHTNDWLAPSDPVRDAIMSRPRGALDASPNAAISGQIRKLSGKTVPDHPFMSRRGLADGSPGATAPTKLGITQEAPLPSRNAYGDNKNG